MDDTTTTVEEQPEATTEVAEAAPAEVQPTPRTFTESELSQILTTEVSKAEARVQSAKDRELGSERAQKQYLDRAYKALEAKVDDLIEGVDRNIYPEVYQELKAKRDAIRLEAKGQEISAREQVLSEREMSEFEVTAKRQWHDWKAKVLEQVKLTPAELREFDLLLNSSGPQWQTNQHLLYPTMVAIVERNEKARLAEENAKLTKELGKAKEKQDLGEPLPIEGGGALNNFAEVEKAFAEGRVTLQRYTEARRKRGLD